MEHYGKQVTLYELLPYLPSSGILCCPCMQDEFGEPTSVHMPGAGQHVAAQQGITTIDWVGFKVRPLCPCVCMRVSNCTL